LHWADVLHLALLQESEAVHPTDGYPERAYLASTDGIVPSPSLMWLGLLAVGAGAALYLFARNGRRKSARYDGVLYKDKAAGRLSQDRAQA
jgi:hypothetical protein